MDANTQVIHGATENQKKYINEGFLFFSGAFRGKLVALLENRTHPADVSVVNGAATASPVAVVLCFGFPLVHRR